MTGEDVRQCLAGDAGPTEWQQELPFRQAPVGGGRLEAGVQAVEAGGLEIVERVPHSPHRIFGMESVALQGSVDQCRGVFLEIPVLQQLVQAVAGVGAASEGRERHRGMAARAATGLTMRHDHGSQYMSDDFQAEVRFLGIVSSPTFVRQPEGNGCIERFFRTLKEQLLWVRHVTDVEDLQ